MDRLLVDIVVFGVGFDSIFGVLTVLGEGQGNGDDDEVADVVIAVVDVVSGGVSADGVSIDGVSTGVVVSAVDAASESWFEVEAGGSTGGGDGDGATAAAVTIGCGSSFNSLFIMLIEGFVVIK